MHLNAKPLEIILQDFPFDMCCGSVPLDQFPENAKPLGIWTVPTVPDVLAWQDWLDLVG
jgi:hypothetical protein